MLEDFPGDDAYQVAPSSVVLRLPVFCCVFDFFILTAAFISSGCLHCLFSRSQGVKGSLAIGRYAEIYDIRFKLYNVLQRRKRQVLGLEAWALQCLCALGKKGPRGELVS